MSTSNNVTLARRFWDGLNKRDLGIVDKCLAEDFVGYQRPGGVVNRRAYKLTLAALLDTFPDLHVTEEQVVAEGDTVALCSVIEGTDDKSWLLTPDTGKRLTMQQACFMRFSGGKISELRSYYGGKIFY